MSPAVFNATPFAPQCLLMMDKDGQLMLCVMVCATFTFDATGRPRPAAQQPAVALADEPYGEPGRSSLACAVAAGPARPQVDFIVRGAAHAPAGTVVDEVQVGIRVGTWAKALNVVGNRRGNGFWGRSPSPEPFSRMPIRYERAFGGTLVDPDAKVLACHPENPVGLAWKGARSADPDVRSDLPNVSLAGQRMNAPGDSIAVAGFGAIAPHWMPRAGYAGTYDGAWLLTRFPVPPEDLDPRFAQCAPADQRWPDAMPGAEVQVLHMTPEGRWRFAMPAVDLRVNVFHSGGMSRHPLRVDMVLLDTEAKTVSLLARHCLGGLRQLGLVREIVVGDPTDAWQRARRAGKRYIGRRAPALAD